MLRFEGDRDFAMPPAELYARLTDPAFLVQCIPDVESVGTCTADHATLVIRPGFSFVRGTLELDLRVADRVEPTSARVLLLSKGIGSSSEVEAQLTLAEQSGGTRVHWTAEVKRLDGFMKFLPAGLIRGAAEKVINDAWERVRARLEAP